MSTECKTALVTGTSSGIGKAIAKRLIDLGYKVVGCARRANKLDLLKQELGDNFVGIQADLTKEDDIYRLFKEASEHLGSVDVLVNNAGIGYETSLIDGKPEHWKHMLDLNVYSVSLLCHLAVNQMLTSEKGHIFNISSMSAHRVAIGGGMYSASKYAVKALTEGLRQELCQRKSKVRVTAVSPGFVRTEFYNSYYEDMSEKEQDEMFEQMEALESSDIADAIIYALQSPSRVGVNDILIRPIEQLS